MATRNPHSIHQTTQEPSEKKKTKKHYSRLGEGLEEPGVLSNVTPEGADIEITSGKGESEGSVHGENGLSVELDPELLGDTNLDAGHRRQGRQGFRDDRRHRWP